MATIKFKVSIISKGKGNYIARADELSIAVEPATTQRGAIKKLKTAVLARFRHAAEDGYNGMLIHYAEMKAPLACHVFNTEMVLLSVPQNLARTSKQNRMKKR
jgi:hypothetical protein